METKDIECCRVCSSKSLYPFLVLPNMPMPEGHYRIGKDPEPFVADIPLVWCEECDVVQMGHDINLTEYYDQYSFNVSKSSFVTKFMAAFAKKIWNDFNCEAGDLVLEVGSGDGSQLKFFKDLGAQVIGVEPSLGLVKEAKENGVVSIHGLFETEIDSLLEKYRSKVGLIFSQYTFDHLFDPVNYLKKCHELIDRDKGIVAIEVHDFEKIVERNEACLFTHEHPTYTSKNSIRSILKLSGLECIKTDLLPDHECRANSMIILAASKESRMWKDRFSKVETHPVFASRKEYDRFAEDILESHKSFSRYIKSSISSGKRIAGYGAAARGVNTLALAQINDKMIEAIFDLNEHFHGKVTPCTKIPVHPPEQLGLEYDELIVFSYGYIDEITNQYESAIANGMKVTSVLDVLKS